MPILARNYLEDKERGSDLLTLKFEKSPIGKPFVFSESFLEFKSIEVTVYPEVISKLYLIFIADALEVKKRNEINKNPMTTAKKKNGAPKKPVVQESHDLTTSMGLQYQIIRGTICSPWVIIPLSHTNDTSK